MISEGDLRSFVSGHSLYRALQPWWDVFCHYLSVMMFIIATLGGTFQITVHNIMCVPCQMTSENLCGSTFHDGIFVNGSASESRPGYLHKAFGIYKLDLQQYNYIDAKCSQLFLHWFVRFFPYIMMLQTLVLVILSNFWLKYPSTSSRLGQFIATLRKCCDSPWTTRALSETVAEQGDTRNSMTSSHPETKAPTMMNESKPLGVDLLNVLDKKEGEQAKALFEKVKKLKGHVDQKAIIFHIYMVQIIAKMVLLSLMLAYLPYMSRWMLFDVDCKVDFHVAIPFQTFRCVFPLATIFWFLSLLYTALVVAYFLTCFYSFLWMVKNSLKQYSFDVVQDGDLYSEIPSVKNDFAFILHLLDQSNPLLVKHFAVFLSEVSEKKLRQVYLNNVWPLEKLTKIVKRNPQEQVELHLMLLSGIPDAVFELKELEVLKLQSVKEPKFSKKIWQLSNLKEVWLDRSPVTVEDKALDFLSEKLRILRLTFTDTCKIPQWITDLKNLTELYVDGDLLPEEKETFVNGVLKLKELRVLCIKFRISSLPKAITASLPFLEKLLVDNEGTPLSAPQGLNVMSHLTCLKLVNCGLQRIPISMFSLKKLQKIYLKGNSLKTIDELISYEHLPGIFASSLDYSNIYSCIAIQQLHLSHNCISSLPSQLFLCNRLYHLDVSHNKLCAIPDEIQNLKRLQVLNLSYNKIDVLPNELFKCKTLEHLILNHNYLSTVPAQISELTYLNLLDLRGNQLESLPTELAECQNLKPFGLLAEEGLLKSLPHSIKENFRRTEKQYTIQLEADGSANSAGCNLMICDKGCLDNGLT